MRIVSGEGSRDEMREDAQVGGAGRTRTAATACMKRSSVQVHTPGKRSRRRRWPCGGEWTASNGEG
jgi:hypothetical protein